MTVLRRVDAPTPVAVLAARRCRAAAQANGRVGCCSGGRQRGRLQLTAAATRAWGTQRLVGLRCAERSEHIFAVAKFRASQKVVGEGEGPGAHGHREGLWVCGGGSAGAIGACRGRPLASEYHAFL